MRVIALGGTSDSDAKSEQRTIGKYRVIDTVGLGGMGVVYRARDPEIGRDVAIKTLRPTIAGSPEEQAETMRRFRLEARSAGNLRHPNIVTIFDANYDDDVPYIVMEFVAGDSLAAILKRNVRLPSVLAIKYLLQLASGIDYAHARGVVHRDLKPNNILVDANDHVFILDFGIAGAHRRIVGSDTGSSGGGVLGTPAYMSPEQVRGAETGKESDLFSFGAMAFEMLTGKLPFRGETSTAIMQSILNGNRTPLSQVAPDLPATLEQVFVRALALDAAQRFPSAHEMVSIMEQMFNRARAASNLTGVQAMAMSRAEARDEAILDAARTAARPTPARPAAEGTAAVSTAELESGERANKASVDDRRQKPGTIFREPTPVIRARKDTPKRATTRDLGNRLVLASAIFAVLVMVPMIVSMIRGAISAPDAGRSTTTPPPVAVVFDELPRPVVAAAPAGKMVAELSDRELLGVMIDLTRPEDQVVEAIEMALDRRTPDFINASVLPLTSPSSKVRLAVVKAIGKFGDRRIVPKVAERLQDSEAVIRIATANTLAELGDRRVVEFMKERYEIEPIAEVKLQIRKAIERISGLPFPGR